jgi:signal transduction histidine kinase/ligand-binding sensor domain-containing protein
MARVTCDRGRASVGAPHRSLEDEPQPAGGARRSLVSRRNAVSPLRAASLIVTLLLALAGLPRHAAAQPEVDLSHWRFYSSVDGMRESWVEDITPGRDGRFWITHGAVDSMTLFDGYTFQRFPTPGVNLSVREGVDGLPWAVHRDGASRFDGIQVFERGQWAPFLLPNVTLRNRSSFVPWAHDKVLLLTTTGLIEFLREDGSTRPIREASDTPLQTFTLIAPRRDGGAWIGGRGMIAIAEPAAPVKWREMTLPAELKQHQVVRLYDAPGGLFITTLAPDTRTMLSVLRPGAADWQVLIRSEPGVTVEGWALANETWVVNRRSLSFTIDLAAGVLTATAKPPFRRVRRTGALSGTFHTALTTPDGSFWIATSLGLARHAPPVWRSPAELTEHFRHVGSLFETRAGELFAASGSSLLWRRNGRWQALPTPGGVVVTDMPDGIGELPDGRLVMNVVRPGSPTLLTFDPTSSTFGWFTHPEGRGMDLLATTREDAKRMTLWMRTHANGASRIESFDGEEFTTRYDAGARWHLVPPRSFLITSNKQVMVLPEQMGIGVLQRDGSYRRFGKDDGYPGAGPFCGIEIAKDHYWFGDRDGIIELKNGVWSVVRSNMQTVRSLVRARDGAIWAAAGTGLHAHRYGSWVNVNAVEGLPDGAVYDVLQDRTGVLWAATSLGLARQHSDADMDTPETILDPRLNPRETPPSGEIRLVFSGEDRWRHTSSRRLMYSWRVDNSGWSPYSVDPGTMLQDLAYGMHRVDVRAIDRNWNVDPTPASLQFRVLLPWYRENGFIAVGLAGLMALGTVIGLVASRHRRLGRLVAERTAELDASNSQLRKELADRQRVEAEHTRLEAQLHQAQKLEAIGRLAGGISHDFNNLLTVIISYAELITSSLRPEHPLYTPAAEISAASQRATALTRQLLAFGRHQVIRPDAIDLNAVVADIQRMLRRLIGEDIDLVFRAGPSLHRTLADRGQIEQVIVNLAVNARDAMPRGGKLTVETANAQIDDSFVRTHAGVSPGDYVLLAVSDTGVGMDADTQARIFEPFFTTKAKEKGYGLGLATVYGIIKQANGHVWTYSEPGRGTTFKIYLPRTDAAPAEATKRAPAEHRRGNEAVLLVEDDDAVRNLASTILRMHGYKVTEAASAEAADVLLRNGHSVDMVLSDIVLSGMSGPELAEKLRKRQNHVRFLFMSGYADDAVIRHGILESEVAFIQKPFTPDALARKVRETLDR